MLDVDGVQFIWLASYLSFSVVCFDKVSTLRVPKTD